MSETETTSPIVKAGKDWGRALRPKELGPPPPPPAKAHFVVRPFCGKEHCCIEYPYMKKTDGAATQPTLVLDIPDKYVAMDPGQLLNILRSYYLHGIRDMQTMVCMIEHQDADGDDSG